MKAPTFLLIGIMTSALLVQFVVVAGAECFDISRSATIRDVRNKASELASAIGGYKIRGQFEDSNLDNKEFLPTSDEATASKAQAGNDAIKNQKHQPAIQANQPNVPGTMNSHPVTMNSRKENVRLSLQILALDQWQATVAA
jgi:hypothetical protein